MGGTQRWSEGGGDEHKGAAHQARLLREAAVTQGRPTQQGGVGKLRHFFVRFFLRQCITPCGIPYLFIKANLGANGNKIGA